MCLAVPMKLVERDEALGVAELDGVRREVSLLLHPEAKLGEYLLVHAGYAIGVVDEAEAQVTLELLRQVAAAGGDA
ncbi:MAG: HypC/HybG/HupF family hydrogenase formation chaperone [Thermoanaerobaculales bacterium]|jgi:hydrogenase expression/formation protein HypC